MGSQDGSQCRGESCQVAVVDAAVVHLTGQLGEQRYPFPSDRSDGRGDLDPPFDDLDG
jgi:hypothetical protein